MASNWHKLSYDKVGKPNGHLFFAVSLVAPDSLSFFFCTLFNCAIGSSGNILIVYNYFRAALLSPCLSIHRTNICLFLQERAALAAASDPYRYVEKRKPIPDPQVATSIIC